MLVGLGMSPGPNSGPTAQSVCKTKTKSMKMSSQKGSNGIPSTESNEEALAKQAKKASLILGALSLKQRNLALQKIYHTLLQRQDEILAENKKDMDVITLLPIFYSDIWGRQLKNSLNKDNYNPQW